MIKTNYHNTKIGLVQINNSFSNQNYLPYSVGLLQAYAQKYLSNKETFDFLLPVYKRIPVVTVLEKLSTADIIFFSTYTWNIKISLEIAKQIKKNKPQVITVFGGPEIPANDIQNFLQKNPAVDIACIGEGEKTFLSILENYSTQKWSVVPSISYFDKNKKFHKTQTISRISNLEEIPSPYLNDVFKPLMEANPNENWIGLWETNRGCPFGCTYCVWGSDTQNKIYTHSLEKLYREIDWFSRHKIEFIFCCDANFGILPRDIEIIKYIADNKKKYGYPKAFSVQNTKNSTMRIYNIYKMMSDAGLSKGVALALQSVNPETLRSIKRTNISVDTFHELQKKFNEENIETFTDIILALPSETYETFINGVCSVIENGQHNKIQLINLSVLTNSEMDELEYQKKYGFEIVETKLVNIHGSLESEEIQETQKLVVGTNTMPKNDWIKARVWSWMVSLLHFDKLLQIPFITLHNTYSIDFREMINIFTYEKTTPILSEIYSFFIDKAKIIRSGGAEFCESKKWLNIWWTPDELVLINICTGNKLSDFYKQSEQILSEFLNQKKIRNYKDILHDSIILNQNLIKLPFQNKNLDLKFSYNIWEGYRAGLGGKKFSLTTGNYNYEIDRTSIKWSSWEDWCREVIWYGNKRGLYLYNCSGIKQ
ncbi:MAG: radical SAM protein [Elusimicrobiota bacterium]